MPYFSFFASFGISIYLICIFSFINKNTFSYFVLILVGGSFGLGAVLINDKFPKIGYFILGF